MVGASMIDASYVREILDYDPLTGAFTWCVRSDVRDCWNDRYAGSNAGTHVGDGYIGITIKSRRYAAHRIAWLHFYGEWPSKHIDHANGVPSDNRISNLREAERWQNQANISRYATNTSGFKGVYWHADRKKWRAIIRANRKRISLGGYNTREEAAAAYQRAALKLHGEFARF
jgi:hypothetical protein